MTTITEATIQKALAGVMGEVQAVGKDGRNQAQNFSFRGIDAVLNAVGPALRKHKVIVLPTVLHMDTSSVEVGQRRTPMGHVTLTVQYTFVGPDASTLQAVVAAEAMDSGDKAISKAMSVAFRTALIQCLALPTDEPDPDEQTYERSAPPGPPPPMSSGQQTRIASSIAAMNDEEAAEFKTWWKGQQLPPKERLNHDQADQVIAHLDELESF